MNTRSPGRMRVAYTKYSTIGSRNGAAPPAPGIAVANPIRCSPIPSPAHSVMISTSDSSASPQKVSR